MEFRYLSIDRQGPIAICTLNNPPSHTLTAAGVSELLAFIGEVEADSGLRVVVFTGTDRISLFVTMRLANSHNLPGRSRPAMNRWLAAAYIP
jgi:enoyl-CoA hydratase/carnithine racemase